MNWFDCAEPYWARRNQCIEGPRQNTAPFTSNLDAIKQLYFRMEFDLITNMDRERHFEATTGADSCLTIIGNGFDLHHDLATKYSD